MESLSALLALAVILFVSTNVDDLVVLIGFFAHSRYKAREIVAGQYAGLALLFAVSATAALLSLVIPKAYVGLFGIFPIFLGIRKLLELRHDPAETGTARALGTATGRYGNVASVALVTVANGGDNIGVYMPSFAVHSGSQIAIIALVFVVMTALWCVLAHWLVSHPRLGAPLRFYGDIFAPFVLIGLGVLIVYNAGSIPALLHHATAAQALIYRAVLPCPPYFSSHSSSSRTLM
jgi:cadmium resistance protein CadD (predicted permease)